MERAPLWAKALFLGLALTDWSQTRWHQVRGMPEHNPWVEQCGRHPACINATIGAGVLLTLGAAELLPPPWDSRLIFAAIAAEAQAIHQNASIGVQVTW